ncbi:MAG: M20/M25/M40 family metallo-hydrolase [Candidatus Coatesbacteria bacterium]|nr:M20/M25/M40 family metallo-hydrolase [Candidatus Coatesbacteria bacterium]
MKILSGKEFNLLSELISINSVFPNEKEIGDFLFDYLKKSGFKTQKQYLKSDRKRFNVLAEKGNHDKSILFYGHMDTVPPYGNWTQSPFELSERNGLLYGLGVNDMKGGIWAILESVKHHEPVNYNLKIAFGFDEENISKGAFLLCGHEFVKDVVFAVIPEVGTSSKMDGKKSVILGRRGRILIEITVPGISAHGSTAKAGINAIREAMRLIPHVLKVELLRHPKLGSENIFVKSFHADTSALAVPDEASFVLDWHIVSPDNEKSCLEKINRIIDNLYERGIFKTINDRRITAKLFPRETPYLLPYTTDEKNQIVKTFIKATGRIFGKIPVRYGLSVADENVFAEKLSIPIVVSGPYGGCEHHFDEWVEPQSLLYLRDSFTEFLLSL